MPNRLDDLTIDEISLVDQPACASTDPETGRKVPRARVALFKRDYDTNEVTNREKRKMPSLQEVINKRSATRDEICAAVDERAVFIAKRTGISTDRARAIVWSDNSVYAAYNEAPVPVAKRAEPRMMEATAAEGLLDRRARKIMRTTKGMSYPQACTKALNDDPSVYEKYTAEMQAGNTYSVPDPQYLDVPLTKQSQDDEDDDPGECDDCGEDVDDGDRFCSSCGTNLATAKNKRKKE